MQSKSRLGFLCFRVQTHRPKCFCGRAPCRTLLASLEYIRSNIRQDRRSAEQRLKARRQNREQISGRKTATKGNGTSSVAGLTSKKVSAQISAVQQNCVGRAHSSHNGSNENKYENVRLRPFVAERRKLAKNAPRQVCICKSSVNGLPVYHSAQTTQISIFCNRQKFSYV